MAQADLELNRAVRQSLVRHWIDLGKISFRSVNGRVYLRGNLVRISGVSEDLTDRIMDNMFNEIRHIRGVTFVNAEFDNWTCPQGTWICTERSKNRGSSSEITAPPTTGEVIDLKG